MSSIRPTFGKVILTDRNTRYPDASDHNAVFAKLRLSETTNANVMTFNVRRYGFDKEPYDWDVNRDHECAQLIHDSGASILAVQECEPEQDAYLIKKLPSLTGVPWAGISMPTNVGIFFKSDRWTMLDWTNTLYDNGTEPDRRLVLALLQSVKTGSQFWFGSTHFGVGPDWAIWRQRQARGVCEYLKAIPGYGDIRQRSVIMGDFNSYEHHTSSGVRKVFDEYGFSDLPRRLSDEDMIGDSYRTNHPFGSLTRRDGRQIDTIFTPR